ncbi:MAG: multidrug ABC transporter permease [Gordonia sp.]|jgi:ABC-2 type transport system permease protein|uniref:Transport permease protein n=1 Tax=Gordonia rubripertincta TaxID=36822 RepID=A0ABT4MPS3_GORRU|nr:MULTISPECIES: ABC transporter permease [Mycobacteriales]MBA4022364.1 multidrug ABC transporter permease [Gordonia sp. (in: high G+C Gram-positive bacteria)]MCZ4549000.1 ABC transporter permease [Gordonia rubripertincta]OZG30086.1 multidrug ABC transporter permease [Williamsia sp. 1138]
MATTIVRDSSIVLVRELRPTIRDPFTVIFSLVQPLILLALFGPLLKDVPGAGDSGNVWNWFIPGVLAMIAIFGTSMTGANLLDEMHTGSHERMLVTPLSRSSLLLGRALKEMVPLAAQAVIILLIGLPLGFDINIGGAAIGIIILGVFGVGLGALSYSLALAVREQDWVFWTVQQTLMFPLLILSGTMLPLDDAPRWMQLLVDINPLHYVVEAERVLFVGDFDTQTILSGVLAAVLMACAGLAVGVRAMGKASRA